MALPRDGSVLSGLCLGTMLPIHPMTLRRAVLRPPLEERSAFPQQGLAKQVAPRPGATL